MTEYRHTEDIVGALVEIFPGCTEGTYRPDNPRIRKGKVFQLHSGVLARYVTALRGMTVKRVGETGADGRTIKEVVDHIAEWDRWSVLSLAAIATGVTDPGIVRFRDYVPHHNVRVKRSSFVSDDDFNAYVAKMVSPARDWKTSRALAIAMASLVEKQAYIVPDDFMEAGSVCTLVMGEVWLTLPCGWYLWAIEIYHHGVEHSVDLYGA